MKILNEIKPTEKEKQRIKKIIESVLKKIKVEDAKLELGGSFAKNTFLKGSHDIDVFVKFPYKKYKDKDLSEILNKKIGLKHKKVHGSRDYFQLEKKGYTFEFIPVLDIKDSSQAMNITDVSPLHKKWVKMHLKSPDEVRLIKKFCRAQNVYGAESYIKGFSGYVLEILTVHYGSFFNLVKAISRWKLPVYVDVEKHHKNMKDSFKAINKSKRQNGLIIVDPTQKDRNAAAAISNEKIESLINSCKEYMYNPIDKFFLEKKILIKDLIAKSGEDKLFLIRIKALKGKKDVIGSKILKVYDYIDRKLREYDFNVLKKGWHFNSDSLLYYIVKDETLPEKVIHYGPPLKQKKHAKEFRNKYREHKTNKGKLYVELERSIKTLKDFKKRLLKDSYVKSNIKRMKIKIL